MFGKDKIKVKRIQDVIVMVMVRSSEYLFYHCTSSRKERERGMSIYEELTPMELDDAS